MNIHIFKMIRKLFNIKTQKQLSFGRFDKLAANAIQDHFRLNNYQMLIIIWLKGLWTGILLSLVLHYFISH